MYDSPGSRYEGGLDFRFWKEFLFGFEYSVTEIDWRNSQKMELRVAKGKATINFSPDNFSRNCINFSRN